MKKARKGFTLVELMIVIGVIGILGAMGIISGQGATSAAKAATILENLNSAASAMMTYYQLNMNDIDKNGLTDTTDGATPTPNVTKSAAEKLAEGANHYIKGGILKSTAADGDYSVTIVGTAPKQDWYVLYTFVPDSTGDTKVKEILASKTDGDLIGTLPDSAGTDGTAFNKDSTLVAIKVR